MSKFSILSLLIIIIVCSSWFVESASSNQDLDTEIIYARALKELLSQEKIDCHGTGYSSNEGTPGERLKQAIKNAESYAMTGLVYRIGGVVDLTLERDLNGEIYKDRIENFKLRFVERVGTSEPKVMEDGRTYKITVTMRLSLSKLKQDGQKILKLTTKKETIAELWDDILNLMKDIPSEPIAPEQPEEDIELAEIKGGWFDMGNDNGYDWEKPAHRVYVDSFYMSKYLVTNDKYKKFMDVNPDYQKNENRPEYLKHWIGNNYLPNQRYHPVINISWNDAMAYCRWLERITGHPYRLPTEAEWEYAARGGLDGNRYPWGNILDHNRANFLGKNGTDQWIQTSPVMSFDPNSYGLYDMAGNVWQWCDDWYEEGYYSQSPEKNPVGPQQSDHPERIYNVLRGGAWNSKDPRFLECSFRSYSKPGDRRDDTGFRVVYKASE